MTTVSLYLPPSRSHRTIPTNVPWQLLMRLHTSIFFSLQKSLKRTSNYEMLHTYLQVQYSTFQPSSQSICNPAPYHCPPPPPHDQHCTAILLQIYFTTITPGTTPNSSNHQNHTHTSIFLQYLLQCVHFQPSHPLYITGLQSSTVPLKRTSYHPLHNQPTPMSLCCIYIPAAHHCLPQHYSIHKPLPSLLDTEHMQVKYNHRNSTTSYIQYKPI